jgi:hypothetical protein
MAHGGGISVSTRPGGGSAFTVTLPAADPRAVAGTTEPDTSPLGAPGGATAHS